jgi:hypothetical protein
VGRRKSNLACDADKIPFRPRPEFHWENLFSPTDSTEVAHNFCYKGPKIVFFDEFPMY